MDDTKTGERDDDRPIESESHTEKDSPQITSFNPSIGNAKSDSARFELREEIARGGMGSIVKVRDWSLNRDLAIKVLIDSDDQQSTQRFFEEAQINGQLQHPGIVPVYEVGRLEDTRPYFAMKLVKGKTLRELLDERSCCEEDRARFLGIFDQVCQTMGYAHSRHVIHRDLKPSNIMVGAFGEVQVMDWGVAKVVPTSADEDSAEEPSPSNTRDTRVRTVRHANGDPTNSIDGVVIGTLAYMSPEQALDDKDRVAETADVFGLGAILCEILTGSPPYEGNTTKKLYRLAARGHMQNVWDRLDDCTADQELIDLAKRSLEYEPELRPANAGVFANEITQYFESVDRRLRQVELDRTKQNEQKKRRKVMMALAGSLVTMALLAAIGFVLVQTKQVEIESTKRVAAESEAERQRELAIIETKANQDSQRAQTREHHLRQDAESTKQETEWMLSDIYADRGLMESDFGNPGAAIMWFAAAADLAGTDEVRTTNNLIRANNWTRSSAIPVGATSVDGRTAVLEFQPSGSLVLARYTPQEYSFRPFLPPTTIFKNQKSEELNWLENIEFPAVQTTKHDWSFTIIDWQNNRVVPWLNSEGNRGVACWNPDGTQVAIGCPKEGVTIRNVADGRIIHQIPQPEEITALAYSQDGSQLAIATDVVQIWNSDSNEFKQGIGWPQPTEVHSISFNQDGSLVAVAAFDSVARVYSTEDSTGNKEPILNIPHLDLYLLLLSYGKHAPVWIPETDGRRRIVGICGKSEVAVWDVDSGEVVERTKRTDGGTICQLQIANDDTLALSAGSETQIRNTNDVSKLVSQGTHSDWVTSAKVDSDNSTFLTGSLDTTAQLWSVRDGSPIGPPIIHNGGVGAVDISDDNQWLATATLNGLIRVWRYPSNQTFRELNSCQHSNKPDFSPDGKFMISRKSDSSISDYQFALDEISVLNSQTGNQVGPVIKSYGRASDACFTADSQSIVVAHYDEKSNGYLSAYDLGASNQRSKAVDLTGAPVWIAAHPLKPIVAVMCKDNQLNMVDIESAKIIYAKQFKAVTHWYSRIKFTPDGEKIVVCNQNCFQALEVETGNPCFDPVIYPNSNGENCAIAISPNSKTIAVSSSDSAMCWSLETAEQIGTPLIHTKVSHYIGAVITMEFSPDSKHLLTSCFDQYARLWDWKTGNLACPPMKHTDQVHCAVFTPDGRYAVSGSRGKECGPHIWELKTGMRVAPSWKAPSNHETSEVHSVAVSPDGQQLFATLNLASKKSLFKYNFGGLRSPGQLSSQQFKHIGELTASKRITLGRTDNLHTSGWLEHWNQFSRLNPRFCREIGGDHKFR